MRTILLSYSYFYEGLLICCLEMSWVFLVVWRSEESTSKLVLGAWEYHGVPISPRMRSFSAHWERSDLTRSYEFCWILLPRVFIRKGFSFHILHSLYAFVSKARSCHPVQRLFPAAKDFMLKFTAQALNLPVERLQARMKDSWYVLVSHSFHHQFPIATRLQCSKAQHPLELGSVRDWRFWQSDTLRRFVHKFFFLLPCNDFGKGSWRCQHKTMDPSRSEWLEAKTSATLLGRDLWNILTHLNPTYSICFFWVCPLAVRLFI